MEEFLLQAPIPGQSLTDEPKNFPWERPAEMSDPEEAIKFHLENLNEPDRKSTRLNSSHPSRSRMPSSA